MPITRKQVKTNSKIKQQQQTLISSKILCPFKKKTKLNKVKIASEKTETKQKTYISPEKIWDQSIIKLGNN